MYKYVSIFIFIVIYVYLFLTKLDIYDRKALGKLNLPIIMNDFNFCLKNVSISEPYHVSSKSVKKNIKIFIDGILIPFRDKIYFEKLNSGVIYSSYIYERYPKLGFLMTDKVYWYYIFKNNNINHPELVVFKKNNNINYLQKIDISKIYITKPIYGMLGFHVRKIKGSDVHDFLEKNDNVLIQEKLVDCLYGKARYFRLVTSFRGDKLILIEYKTDNKTIVPNELYGGKATLCHNLLCEDLSSNLVVRKKMNFMMDQLATLNKNGYPQIISIGWDIMIDCQDPNNINIYCLEGNIFGRHWYDTSEYDGVIKKYKEIVKEFYEMHNI